MMMLDLICIDCIMEKVNKGIPYTGPCEPIMTPFNEVNNTGIYEVNCSKDHKSKTIIDNIDFEILFEYGINAIADGYYRESVTSITSAMERYFEFFIKVILRASNVDFLLIDKIWKNISSQSERQFGAYIIGYSQTFGEIPLLVNPNKDVPFRNSVIHKGYIPSKDEAISYGNTVMQVIDLSLLKLKSKYPKITNEVFDYYGYKRTAQEIFKKIEKETGIQQNYACVNILTTIDVKNGREHDKTDGRKGAIEQRIPYILDYRGPRKLILLKGKSKQKKASR